MATIDYKQKIKDYMNSSEVDTLYKSMLNNLFPELKDKESEDERMIERIKKAVESYWSDEPLDEILGWLEKKCAQKSADKIEPKFHEGEWITNGDYTWKIVEVKPLDYILQSQEGNIVDDTISHVDEQFHSFTIKDAKKGDVLVNDTILIIVDHLGTFENRPIIYSWYFADSKKFYGMGTSEPDRWGVKGFIPATKEQRDTLEKAMADAGWEWSDKDRKLIKIVK